MDLPTTCNICEKSVKDRNSIKYNLCQTKVHLLTPITCFLIKHGSAAVAVKVLLIYNNKQL